VAPVAAQSDYGVCAPRSLAASFAGSSAVLGRADRNAVAYAVDSASVCRLSGVTVAVNGSGETGRRRAQALRAALIARGVPAGLIQVELGAPGTEVRMAFDGVATGGSSAPVNAAAAS
ncbi:MAG: hypothetical protein K2X34_01030, partial [Hyphomonadaceae bacterium]|nr:hypothetical protein [Hyphomonadaceae bacterium]